MVDRSVNHWPFQNIFVQPAWACCVSNAFNERPVASAVFPERNHNWIDVPPGFVIDHVSAWIWRWLWEWSDKDGIRFVKFYQLSATFISAVTSSVLSSSQYARWISVVVITFLKSTLSHPPPSLHLCLLCSLGLSDNLPWQLPSSELIASVFIDIIWTWSMEISLLLLCFTTHNSSHVTICSVLSLLSPIICGEGGGDLITWPSF